jgi:hypothetical protein
MVRRIFGVWRQAPILGIHLFIKAKKYLLFGGYALFVVGLLWIRKLTIEKNWVYDPWPLGPGATFFITEKVDSVTWLLFSFETAIVLALVYLGITPARPRVIWIVAAILVWLACGFLPHLLLI